MGVLHSKLIASFQDRVSRPARGVIGTLGRLRRAGNGFNRSQRALQAPIMGVTRNLLALGAAYLGVREAMRGTLGGAMRLETAMADVAKKTSLSNAQLKETEKRIISLSNQKGAKSAVEIATLYAQAGQFGIANKDLDRFVKLGSKASIGFDMGAEETANSLSQLKNALGLTIPGLEDLADAINFTADNAGTSERKLIDFLLRTSASAKAYGISGQEMAAFGATLNEIGLESSKAGTGMNAMMAKLSALTSKTKVVKTLDTFAGKGYSKQLQKQFFQTPVDAMRDFFKVVQKMDVEKRSGLLIDFFGLEYQDDASAIANNIDKIVDRLELLRDTSKFAGSVDKTFEIFANTSEEKLKRLKRIFENSGAYLGAQLLPPIVDAAERISNTLTSLGQRVTVFDQIGARMQGFLTGLGLSGDAGLAAGIDRLWDALFGRTDELVSDTERMGAAFEKFRKMGDDLRSFTREIGKAVSGLESFLGLDHGAVKSAVQTTASYGAILAVGAMGVSLILKPIRMLGSALLFLSGIKPAWGLLKFLGRLAKFAGVGAVGIAGLAKAVTSLGSATDALSGKKAGGKGGFLKALLGAGSTLKASARQSPFLGLLLGLKSAAGLGLSQEGVKNTETNMADPETAKRFDPMKGFNVLQEMENKLKANPPAKEGSRLDNLHKMGSEGTPLVTRPSGVQEVRVTNPSQPNVTVHASITVNEASNAAQIAREMGGSLKSTLESLQADGEWAGA